MPPCLRILMAVIASGPHEGFLPLFHPTVGDKAGSLSHDLLRYTSAPSGFDEKSPTRGLPASISPRSSGTTLGC